MVFVTPSTSVAVHVTTVSPSGKNSGALLVKVVESEKLFFSKIPKSISDAVISSDVASTRIREGATTSTSDAFTEINCSVVEMFPEKSVAVHVTTVSPSGKNSGALLVTFGNGSTKSVTLGATSESWICGIVAIMDIGEIDESVGAVESSTIT